MTIAIAATNETRPPALRRDHAHSVYRCPTCDQPPQNLRLGPIQIFLCSDCAAYWPTHHSVPDPPGFWDPDAADRECRSRGCLDHPGPEGPHTHHSAARGHVNPPPTYPRTSAMLGRSTTSNSNNSDSTPNPADDTPCAISRPCASQSQNEASESHHDSTKYRPPPSTGRKS